MRAVGVLRTILLVLTIMEPFMERHGLKEYLGVHYPGDILGGAVLGIVVGLIVYWLYWYVSELKVVKKIFAESTKSQIPN